MTHEEIEESQENHRMTRKWIGARRLLYTIRKQDELDGIDKGLEIHIHPQE